MKNKLIVLFLAVTTASQAVSNLQPQSNIKASDINANFNQVKELFLEKEMPLNFSNYSSGELIDKSKLEADFDLVRALELPVSSLESKKITADELNQSFNDMLIASSNYYPPMQELGCSSLLANESSCALDTRGGKPPYTYTTSFGSVASNTLNPGVCLDSVATKNITLTVKDSRNVSITKNVTMSCDNNYWGSGADGDFVSTGTSSDALCDSTVDGPTCVKQFKNFTVNLNHTVTTAVRRRGLVIYVQGDAVINGKVSMTARGAIANPDSLGVPASGLTFARKVSSGSQSGSSNLTGTNSALQSIELKQGSVSNGKLISIARYGSVGGAAQTSAWHGNSASPGVLSSGGGGGGAGGVNNRGSIGPGGAGGQGTAFSGGAGAGAGTWEGWYGGAGSPYGGAGGSASTAGGGNFSSGGGAGNPGGSAGVYGGDSIGKDGTGGLIVIIVKGNITIGSSGGIESNGSAGGNASGAPMTNTGGGGSGGGNIVVIHAGSISSTSKIMANGGPGGQASGGFGAYVGGNGGNGSVQIHGVLK